MRTGQEILLLAKIIQSVDTVCMVVLCSAFRILELQAPLARKMTKSFTSFTEPSKKLLPTKIAVQ